MVRQAATLPYGVSSGCAGAPQRHRLVALLQYASSEDFQPAARPKHEQLLPQRWIPWRWSEADLQQLASAPEHFDVYQLAAGVKVVLPVESVPFRSTSATGNLPTALGARLK